MGTLFHWRENVGAQSNHISIVSVMEPLVRFESLE